MSVQPVNYQDSPAASAIADAPPVAPRQLDIAIIGAGLVGLATAAMLRKEGHRITIFESSSFHAEIGAGIVVPPNGVGVLNKMLPELNWDNMQTVDFRSFEAYAVDGTHMLSDDISEAWRLYPQGWFCIHRVDMHKEIMRLALDRNAMSLPPASIRLGAAIKSVNFDPARPSVTTTDGKEYTFDLVLGADGIKSTVRKCMVGPEYNAPPDEFAFYRWMIDLQAHPELAWIRDERKSSGPTAIIRGKEFEGIFSYPLRRGNIINISAGHRDKRKERNDIEWNEDTPAEAFHENFHDFCPKFMALVNAAEAPRTWQLRKLPTLPTWIKGNVAIMGDAAHAMYPTYGQGLAIGMEDAGTLATLLQQGTKASDIPARLRMFQQTRKPRAERVSLLSSRNQKTPQPEESHWVKPELLGYDAVAVAKQALLSKS
ncbi:FAD/NAD(P)-binding domain-containing protein [Favolaschia claudopus]|uniref:FAD/NAD(P)-binding domain-containing protein n=1 Tax=Favolaschia claudopus TaxID=2862362 RepID=A0AAW0CUH8_9AGAR